MNNQIYFRVDASAEIGLGHFTRCVAIARLIKEFSNPIFMMEACPDYCVNVCNEEHLPLHKLTDGKNSTLDMAIPPFSVVVLDGYHFGPETQRLLKNKNCLVISIDDLHQEHFYSDIIINHGVISSSVYSVEPYCKLFLGPDYLMLRSEFIDTTKFRSLREHHHRILVSIGGTDYNNYNQKISEWLLSNNSATELGILASSTNPNYEGLKKMEQSNHVRVYANLNPNQIIDLMRSYDLAILSSSTICLEACAVGIGILAGLTADNQQDMYRLLVGAETIIGLGELEHLTQVGFLKMMEGISIQSVNRMIQQQMRFIDGESNIRLKNIFYEIICNFKPS